MLPNKLLTSGSPLQIPINALQRLPSLPADSLHSQISPQDPALEQADFSATGLSDQQIIVLRAIASGKGISAAAQEAGVSRPTIYRWQRDPHFQKWLDAWKAQTKESGRNIMLTLIERSTRIVERALDKDDIRVALTLLTKLGVLAANDGVKDIAAIAGEGTTNELELKNGDPSSSRRG